MVLRLACPVFDDGENQAGRMPGVMEDAVDGWPVLIGGFGRDVSVGVAVAVEPREVAAGDLERDAVAG
jgi:hypothetical protein